MEGWHNVKGLYLELCQLHERAHLQSAQMQVKDNRTPINQSVIYDSATKTKTKGERGNHESQEPNLPMTQTG